MRYKIRMRERIDRKGPPMLGQRWTEYQIVVGNKIVARCANRGQAERIAAKEYGAENEIK
jgi:hypothetical protein